MSRRSFVGALCALLISGTINPDEIDNELSYSPATPGEYKVTTHDGFTSIGFLETGKVYSPYVPLYVVRL